MIYFDKDYRLLYASKGDPMSGKIKNEGGDYEMIDENDASYLIDFCKTD
jgi:hypothetical protein